MTESHGEKLFKVLLVERKLLLLEDSSHGKGGGIVILCGALVLIPGFADLPQVHFLGLLNRAVLHDEQGLWLEDPGHNSLCK